jgi:DNA-binding MarR family transcriptional regulator
VGNADEPRGDLRRQLLDHLRRYGTDYEDLRRAFAAWLDMHPTDAGALTEIANQELAGRPLTSAALARRVRLSPGATSNLLNRLEKDGYVRRGRDDNDGRKVILRTGGQAADLARGFFDPVAARLGAVMDHYSDDQLSDIADFLDDVHRAMRELLTTPPPRAGQPGVRHPAPRADSPDPG